MADTSELVGQVAYLEAGPGRVLVFPADPRDPIGLLSMERGLCEPAPAELVQSIDDDPVKPLADRMVNAGLKLWESLDARKIFDLAQLSQTYQATLLSIVTDSVRREAYLTGAMTAYAQYMEDYAKGYLDLLLLAYDVVRKAWGFEQELFEFTIESLIGLGTGTIDFEDIAARVTGEAAPYLIPVITTFGEIHAWFTTLRENPEVLLGAALEVVATIATVAVEHLADAEIISALQDVVADPAKLGDLHGTLIGIVVAEIIIDELITAGAGKLVRGVRTMTTL